MNYTDITYIYGLYDLKKPNTIRYIGKSNNPKRRLTAHKWERRSKLSTRKINWIKSLDGKIGMKILKICPLSDFEEYEANIIQLYKSENLTNSDESGQGNKGRKSDITELSAKKISKKVYQFDINGNYIKEYPSIRQASRELNIYHSHIIRCCNGEIKHTTGFIFTHNKNKKIDKIDKPNAIKKMVIETDINGQEINKWKSLMECSRHTGIDNGNLSRVCNNKLHSIKGRFFKFI